MCAVRELWEALQKIGKLKLDLDDFREVNKKIFDFEEKEMESIKAYRILSLLCVSLLGPVEAAGCRWNADGAAGVMSPTYWEGWRGEAPRSGCG